MTRYRVPGIFCVEGSWSSNLADRASVRDLLEIIENVDGIDFIHHSVSNEDGLFDALRKWKQKQYSHYAICYFAFHGKPGKILIGRHPVTLRQLQNVLEGACHGKILYFGSCSVLKVPPAQIQRFLKATKAEAVVGFQRDIDWLASAALDMILLQALALQDYPREAERYLRTEYGSLADALGLEIHFDPQRYEQHKVSPIRRTQHLMPFTADPGHPQATLPGTEIPFARAKGDEDSPGVS